MFVSTLKCKFYIYIAFRNVLFFCNSFVNFVPTHLVELVLLAELDTLFPAVVAFKKIGCDPPEFNQLVLLQALGERDVVEVVVSVDGSAQRLSNTRNNCEIRLRKQDAEQLQRFKCVLAGINNNKEFLL